MSDPNEDARLDALEARIAELAEENERLKTEVTGGGVRTDPARTWRWVAAVLLVVVGSVIAVSAIGAMWVNRVVMDTDTFVSTLAPLSEDPDVQQAIAAGIDDAIFSRVDIQGGLTNLLAGLQNVVEPELKKRGIDVGALPAEALAAPLATAIQDAIRQQTSTLIASPQFSQLFESSLREGHTAFLAALTGGRQASEAGLISVNGDTVYLEVNAFATVVKERLVAAGLTFLSDVSLTRAQGQVKLFSSPALIQTFAAIRLLNTLAWVLPLLALVLLGGAVFAAPDRRRGLLVMSAGLVTASFIALLGINVGRTTLASGGELQGPQIAAVLAAYDILLGSLIMLLRLAFGIGILVLLGTVLTGPARWAESLRTWISDLASGTGRGAQFAEFVTRWRTPLAGGGVLIGVLVAVALPISAIGVFWIGVILLVWVFGVETIGRGHPPSSGADRPSVARTSLRRS